MDGGGFEDGKEARTSARTLEDREGKEVVSPWELPGKNTALLSP